MFQLFNARPQNSPSHFDLLLKSLVHHNVENHYVNQPYKVVLGISKLKDVLPDKCCTESLGGPEPRSRVRIML